MGETARGGEGCVSERWKRTVSPRPHEEVGPEMSDKGLPLPLYLPSGVKKGLPRGQVLKTLLRFYSLLTPSLHWKSK